jgi:hypothetical protein
MIAVSRQPEPLPADTEAGIGEFTQLVATAISNIEARAELARSRARIVAAADEERRRMVRDLHDGAQQRLVHASVDEPASRMPLWRTDRAGGLDRRSPPRRANALHPSALRLQGRRIGLAEFRPRVCCTARLSPTVD